MTHPGGRPRKIESPERLEELFIKYKVWASQNPWIKKDFIKSGEFAGQIVDLPTERPLTEWGLAVFIGMSRSNLIEYSKRPEFQDIYARIKDEMSEQKISGGLSGAYNPMLVSRIEGIAENQNLNLSGKVVIDIEDDSGNEEISSDSDTSDSDRSGDNCDGTV